jgi:hypothetical protein
MISEETTGREDAIVDPQRLRITSKRVRRNVNDLSDAEFKRYYMAIYELKAHASPAEDPLNDWWNLCSIHGGHFHMIHESKMHLNPCTHVILKFMVV